MHCTVCGQLVWAARVGSSSSGRRALIARTIERVGSRISSIPSADHTLRRPSGLAAAATAAAVSAASTMPQLTSTVWEVGGLPTEVLELPASGVKMVAAAGERLGARLPYSLSAVLLLSCRFAARQFTLIYGCIPRSYLQALRVCSCSSFQETQAQRPTTPPSCTACTGGWAGRRAWSACPTWAW